MTILPSDEYFSLQRKLASLLELGLNKTPSKVQEVLHSRYKLRELEYNNKISEEFCNIREILRESHPKIPAYILDNCCCAR